MNLEGIAVLIILVILIIVLLHVLVGVMVIVPFANALSITAHNGQDGLVAYNIMMNVKINNHPVQMELDTGMDFTLIPTNTASQLGLDQLPSSGYCQLTGISGGPQSCDVKTVTMQIENGHPFYAKVAIAPPSGSNMPPLLSTYTLYQAYRLQFIPIR